MNLEITTTTRLEGIAIKIDAHGKAAIDNILTVGKLLCEARELLPANNEFGEWREHRLPWLNQKMAYRWMNAYQNGGEKLIGQNVRTSILYALTAPDVPESAREEALEHESLTVKQTKELTQANKRIAELTAENEQLRKPMEPDLKWLIPELDKLYRGGSIVLARAKQLSVLPPDKQEIYLEEFHSKEWHRKQEEMAKAKAGKAMEQALEAIKEKETAMAKLEEVAGTDNSQIMLKHEADLKRLKEEYLDQLREAKKEAAKEASELHEKLNKEKIQQAEKEKATAERKEKEIREKANAAWKHNNELTFENKKLKAQLEVDKPSNIDNARALKLERELKNLDWVFPDIISEAQLAGGKMHETKKVVIEIINKWSSLLQNLEGNEIIEISN